MIAGPSRVGGASYGPREWSGIGAELVATNKIRGFIQEAIRGPETTQETLGNESRSSEVSGALKTAATNADKFAAFLKNVKLCSCTVARSLKKCTLVHFMGVASFFVQIGCVANGSPLERLDADSFSRCSCIHELRKI